MRSAKTLKNNAVLRNLTDLKPIMHNEKLLEIHDSRDRDIEIGDTTRFQGKVIKYRKMLRTIDIVTKEEPYIIWM